MKSPSARYLTGYVFRAIFGTLLVLGAISAGRIIYPEHLPHTQADESSPWEKSLIYPDRLVNFLLTKYATNLNVNADTNIALLPDTHPATPHSTKILPDTRLSSIATSVARAKEEHTPPDTRPPTHNMPNMPTLPSAASSNTRLASVTTSAARAKEEPVPPDTGEWGVTIAPKAPIYGTNGKLLGRVPAGSLLKVIRHKKTTSGDLVVCTIMLNGRKQAEAFIRLKDTTLHGGSLSATTSEERTLCIRHARLLADITAREKQLKDSAAGRNPHMKEYAKAAREYKQLATKANTLRKAYNSASGPRRMEIADELRNLKHDEVRISQAYKTAKKQKTAWQIEHPATEPDLDGDSQLQRLRQEVAAVEQKLTAL